jgi:hypothetical protein
MKGFLLTFLICLFTTFNLCARTDWYINPTNGANGNVGSNPSLPWQNFSHINFHGLGTPVQAGDTVHIAGTYQGNLGLDFQVYFLQCLGTSNQPIIFTNWLGPNWTITQTTNEDALLFKNNTWCQFYNLIVTNCNAGESMTHTTNCGFYNCQFVMAYTSPMFSLSQNSVSNYFTNCLFSTIITTGSGCSDGGTDLLYIGNYQSVSDFSDYNIVENSIFQYEGHAGLELASNSNYCSGCTFINPCWYLENSCQTFTNSEGFVYTNYSYWSGRQVSIGGERCSGNVFQNFKCFYGGQVPDQPPGGVHIENAGNTILRNGLMACSATAGLEINTEEPTQYAGSNCVYNCTIALCGFNTSFYVGGQVFNVYYPIYQSPIVLANTTNTSQGFGNNVLVNNLMWANYQDYISLPGTTNTLSTICSYYANNWTNTDPGFPSLVNTLSNLPTSVYPLPNCIITGNSAAAGSGGWLTYITSPSANNVTSFNITNFNLFSMGRTACFRTIPSDTIELAGGQITQITSINGNTLSVYPPVNITNNMGVALPYLNNRPSVGYSDALIPQLFVNGTPSANLKFNSSPTNNFILNSQ